MEVIIRKEITEFQPGFVHIMTLETVSQKSFHGNEGVVGLTLWIEKTVYVFKISLCVEEIKVTFTIYTLEDTTLSWWVNYMKTMCITVANSMAWSELKQLMI